MTAILAPLCPQALDLTSRAAISLMLGISTLALNGSCTYSSIHYEPEAEVKINGRKCRTPPKSDPDERQTLSEATLKFRSTLRQASDASDLEEAGWNLYYSAGGDAARADWIACSTMASIRAPVALYDRVSDGIIRAMDDEKAQAREVELRRSRAELERRFMASREASSRPECGAEVRTIVEHLLHACENERKTCPKNPVPPEITAEEFEKIIDRLPHWAVFYELNQYKMPADAQRDVDAFHRMHIKKDTRVLIIGRASKPGGEGVNYMIAKLRAESVFNYLETLDPSVSSFENPKYEILNFGEKTLYMRPDSFLGKKYSNMYRNEDHLNQSAWIVAYDC